MTRKRSDPIRTCLGCRRRRPKGEMLRLIRATDGRVSVDDRGPGRGAYVCRDPECQERAFKPGRLAHAFRRPSDARVDASETAVSGKTVVSGR